MPSMIVAWSSQSLDRARLPVEGGSESTGGVDANAELRFVDPLQQ